MDVHVLYGPDVAENENVTTAISYSQAMHKPTKKENTTQEINAIAKSKLQILVKHKPTKEGKRSTNARNHSVQINLSKAQTYKRREEIKSRNNSKKMEATYHYRKAKLPSPVKHNTGNETTTKSISQIPEKHKCEKLYSPNNPSETQPYKRREEIKNKAKSLNPVKHNTGNETTTKSTSQIPEKHKCEKLYSSNNPGEAQPYKRREGIKNKAKSPIPAKHNTGNEATTKSTSQILEKHKREKLYSSNQSQQSTTLQKKRRN
ncbi:934_t:CDS:2 [Scutellospora calospora]|uniref:934_t:CDS:1 n=1 Tax=Scutellospora calospora TaxID=85575 RepID=A0ACA9JUS0_9GLOM|nr:934_t:CDS:2 [Scutellospora calospora]